MQIYMPPSDTEKNVEAIRSAVFNKELEVKKAYDELEGKRAELRGLQQALDILSRSAPKRTASVDEAS